MVLSFLNPERFRDFAKEAGHLVGIDALHLLEQAEIIAELPRKS